jgi:putative hydrolase of the HAD superfamily
MGEPLTTTRAVVFDFYGTLGESNWEEWWIDTVLGARGYRLTAEIDRRWSLDEYDGREHLEHSETEAHYRAWLDQRWEGLLRDCGVRADEVPEVLEEMALKRDEFSMRLYPEVPAVLTELRARGLRLAVCSNWDWDLDRHLADVGLSAAFDARVSSAWVGARKPHRRIFEATLAALEVDAADAVFVGDNWRADVEGPRAVGMRAVHVWRHDEHPGEWLPVPPPPPPDVPRIRDLSPLPSLL